MKILSKVMMGTILFTLSATAQIRNIETQTAEAGSYAAHQADVSQENVLFKQLYDSYFGVKDALVKSDAATASAKAKELVKAVKSIPMDKMQREQHNVWMENFPKIQEDAEQIAKAKDVKQQRERFARLSSAMYKVAKAFDPKETVYYQKCPMYNDGKGANWLSKEPGIKNPYYGSKMLTCGKTVETIK